MTPTRHPDQDSTNSVIPQDEAQQPTQPDGDNGANAGGTPTGSGGHEQ